MPSLPIDDDWDEGPTEEALEGERESREQRHDDKQWEDLP